MRAEVFGDIIFVDYGSVKKSSASARTSHHKKKDTDSSREGVSPSYDFLIVLDGATNFIYATPLDTQEDSSGQQGLRDFIHHMQVNPKRIVGDQAFMSPSWKKIHYT